ncbi:MAG: hypothetical protein WHT09_08975 [Thermogutta sp.]
MPICGLAILEPPRIQFLIVVKKLGRRYLRAPTLPAMLESDSSQPAFHPIATSDLSLLLSCPKLS